MDRHSGRLWPSSVPALLAAIEALPAIQDDTVADIVEMLAITIVDREEELRAVRLVLSHALGLVHQQKLDLRQMREQRDRLLTELRARSTARAA
jgi:hypothetical protein